MTQAMIPRAVTFSRHALASTRVVGFSCALHALLVRPHERNRHNVVCRATSTVRRLQICVLIHPLS